MPHMLHSLTPRPLTADEAEASRREHGSNRLTVKDKQSFFRRFIGNLGDPVIRILLGALVLNVLFSVSGEGADWIETGGIALAVLLATLISTLSEYTSEAAFARLSEESARASCRVKRREADGRTEIRELPLTELAVGDVVMLGAGEMIPADGILLTGRLQVDQSAMTGESREVEKTPMRAGEAMPDELSPDQPHTLLRGCMLLGGQGEMLVTRVGVVE